MYSVGFLPLAADRACLAGICLVDIFIFYPVKFALALEFLLEETERD